MSASSGSGHGQAAEAKADLCGFEGAKPKAGSEAERKEAKRSEAKKEEVGKAEKPTDETRKAAAEGGSPAPFR